MLAIKISDNLVRIGISELVEPRYIIEIRRDRGGTD